VTSTTFPTPSSADPRKPVLSSRHSSRCRATSLSSSIVGQSGDIVRAAQGVDKADIDVTVFDVYEAKGIDEAVGRH
jgi:hypothetical protein